MKKIQEEILKALKEEMLKDHATECRECMAESSVDFFANIPNNKILPKKIMSENNMSDCFYRFCCILQYYFNIDPKEIIKIYEKYERSNELIFCKNYSLKKELQQEVYNLCFKYFNVNKI